MAGLEDLYKEIILDHSRSPRNKGELPPPATRTEGFNPLCGDEIVVFIDVGDDGVIADIKIGGQGCSISQSSASMMSMAIKGKTIAEAQEITGEFKAMMNIHGETMDDTSADSAADAYLKLGDLEALKGVVKYPVRIKCATLSWNTLSQAIEEATS